MVQYDKIHARRDALLDSASSMIWVGDSRTSKGGDVDPLPDVSTCCQMKWWI